VSGLLPSHKAMPKQGIGVRDHGGGEKKDADRAPAHKPRHEVKTRGCCKAWCRWGRFGCNLVHLAVLLLGLMSAFGVHQRLMFQNRVLTLHCDRPSHYDRLDCELLVHSETVLVHHGPILHLNSKFKTIDL
jgi:hypothetical protein